ncbi:hypothetical protein BLJAPNOD_04382 [Ensifer sp. M14]|jgi:catechol 2,3-dioxygenase-like lactoylglutathione lyase family enzyme|uniref:VOC family protein n=1 Tax=Ensifer sp. M14 TaxID=2203782 RepID=UPI000E1D5AAF|nr:VOC family protein [Ensifer sp. M14]RDL48107.1 hypothetical protein BLJAPNOD_04382 [Ensifer sp. M14]
MRPMTASPCITTQRIDETRHFYTNHLGAKVVFDCDWYISLEFEGGQSLQFMEPQQGQALCDPAGLTYNFRVADVDTDYAEITASGLQPSAAIEDHPWGDRGFAIQDPNGITLYIYSDREPAPEFKSFYKA